MPEETPFPLGYGTAARWLGDPPSEGELAAILQRGAPPRVLISGEARAAWETMEVFIDSRGPEQAARDAAEAHWTLLQDPFGSRLNPYASVYLDRARLGPALVKFRAFLKRWGLVPDRERYRDLEDHAAFQLDCLAWLASEAGRNSAWVEAYRECMEGHVLPWMPRFLADLEAEDRRLSTGGFYAPLARLVGAWLASDASVLGLETPVPAPPGEPPRDPSADVIS